MTIAQAVHSKWAGSLQTLGACMICMEMFGNGAGISTVHTWAVRRQIQRAHLLGLAARCEAVAGAIQLRVSVRRTGAAVLPLAGTTASVSVLCAIRFNCCIFFRDAI